MKGSTRGYTVICFSIWFVSLIIGSAAWLNTLAGLETPVVPPGLAGEQYVDVGEVVFLPDNNQKAVKRI